jgi:hypothetical protein
MSGNPLQMVIFNYEERERKKQGEKMRGENPNNQAPITK